METPPEGGLRRRAGFARPDGDMLYDNIGDPLTDPNHGGSGVFYHNHDHHHQGATREPISMLFESTGSDGTRRRFDATQSRISVLNQSLGHWTDIATGQGAAGTRFKAAELADYVLFTNYNDDILSHQLGTGTTSTITELKDLLKVRKARVIVQYLGFILIMNLYQDDGSAGAPWFKSRVRWSDLNLPLSWDPGAADTLAGFQDLDYGDEILAAAPMLGALYILTRRSIWRVTVGSANSTFNFTRVYNEPRNQKGCIVYPNTLISTGSDLYYLSRESAYHYSPYVPEPERLDWLYKSTGVIFEKLDTKLIGVSCDAPVGEFVPVKNELWFSWPSGANARNNLTLVLQTDNKTADVVDHGFVCFSNNRRNPQGDILCNENQDFLGVSASDWAIKAIGGAAFYRELVTLDASGDPTIDLPLNSPDAVYYSQGYNSLLRGLMPLGLTDRDKQVRNININHDTADEDEPCLLKLRIGNHYNLVDPNETAGLKSPVWHNITVDGEPGILLKASAETYTAIEMVARNLRPSLGIDFPCYERGRYLWFEFSITNADGSVAIGGDTAWSSMSFDGMGMAKP